MLLTISKERTFIPEFNGNRNLPASDQIVVKYRAPTIETKSRCRSRPEVESHADRDGKITGMHIRIDRNDKATVSELLLSISGAAYVDGKGNTVQVVNAHDLFAAPIEFEPLMNEIVKKFDEELDRSEIDEKNSASGSAS